LKTRAVIDVSALPTWGFGSKSPIWWGTLAYIGIETSGFGLAMASYLYLAQKAQEWPLAAPPPNLLPGTIMTGVLVLSLLPNYVLKRSARASWLGSTRFGLVVMSVFGILPLIIRVFEFPALNVYWDTNAYGSIVWLLLGLHTLHIGTDAVDTFVLTALMFTRNGRMERRFSDVNDNAVYWDFVVISWLPIYGLIYWFPRLVG
jgi:heme/copper-type cytochrome/quinol oxidase subunit 3